MTPSSSPLRPSWRQPLAWAALTLALCVSALAPLHAAEVIHTEPSDFSPILVYEDRGERCMKFGSLMAPGRQTCQSLDMPEALVFNYTRMVLGALYLNPNPNRVLVIGLGGGTLSSTLARLLPKAEIDNIEIDPAVVRVAERYFGFTPGERQRVHTEDGRAFVERAVAQGSRYDLVILDAFDHDYIPPHLLTREFLGLVKTLLGDRGILAANTFTASSMYDRESVTYQSVFGRFYNLRANNRVILASAGPLPALDTIRQHATGLAPALGPLGVDTRVLLTLFSDKPDWNVGAATLND